MNYTICTPAPAASTASTSSRNSLDTNLAATLEHARRLTALYGIGATEVAIAWDAFEELLTAKARQADSTAFSPASGFARYCALNPEAPECRVYDI